MSIRYYLTNIYIFCNSYTNYLYDLWKQNNQNELSIKPISTPKTHKIVSYPDSKTKLDLQIKLQRIIKRFLDNKKISR